MLNSVYTNSQIPTNNNRLLLNHLFNCNIAVFMSFSNIWLSELVIIKLVSSAYSTGLDISDIIFGTSLTCKRKSRGPNKNPWGTPSAKDSHSE